MSKAARVSADDTIPPAIIRGHIIPMLGLQAVLCTKRYLSSLDHSKHWLEYRDVMVQLIVSEYESPPDLFVDMDWGATWEDVSREKLLYGWHDWADRIIFMDEVVRGYGCNVFKQTLCTWFTGQPFNTVGYASVTRFQTKQNRRNMYL